MTNKIIRLPQLKEKTGLSRSSIYAFMRSNQFPQSISLSKDGRAVGWLEESVDNWINSRTKAKVGYDK